MFVRTVRVRKGTKVYEYPQLVESYRRPDGKPAHRVVASLKGLTAEQLENLKLALKAGRSGEPVVLAEPAALPVLTANRRYLDVAVVHAFWQEWGLGQALEALVPAGTEVAVGEVIQALVVHRCVAPNSKLAAARWFPTTALPEITGVSPAQFNNSRLHRALATLHTIEAPLRAALRRRVLARQGAWSSLFLDLSDTWFVGRGPSLARHGQTKEGLQRKKIGIALICDERGLPVDWRTVQGGRAEPPVMLELLGEAVKEGWMHTAPVVMDRAMGRFEYITALADMGVRFVTALVRSEIGSYTSEVPCESVVAVKTSGSSDTRRRDEERLASAIEAAGMKHAGGGLYVADLGVVLRERVDGTCDEEGVMARLLRLLLEMKASNEETGVSRAELARRHGISARRLGALWKVTGLAPALRDRVLAGEAEDLWVEELVAVGTVPSEQQEAEFTRLLEVASQRDAKGSKPPKVVDRLRRNVALRLVACFRPRLCLDKRATAAEQLAELEEMVETINVGLARPGSRRTAEQEAGRVREWLRRRQWLSLFQIGYVTRRAGRDFKQLTITRDEDAWRRRRRWDGFIVIAAHPEVIGTPESLARLYWSREVVERGFRTIKSEVELRPVHHHTDPKVQAHVTLCVLALLILRAIEHRLRDAGTPMSAQAVLETLASCHLNQFETRGSTAAYAITQPTPEQLALLAALNLTHLTHEDALAAHEPRDLTH